MMHIMESSFGYKLKELRENKNFSLEDLGQLVNVSRQSIHRYETNKKRPSSSTLLKISEVFDVEPTYFFNMDGFKIKIDNINFREENFIPEDKSFIDNLKIRCEDYLIRLIELESLVNEKHKFINPLEGVVISSRKDVEKAAKNLRKKWKLGFAPIQNVTELIEEKNISIIDVDVVPNFSGLSGYANDEIPFIVINSNCSDITRMRFTLLHELAHLVLEFSESLNNGIREAYCNHFAGAILLVDDAIVEELGKNRRVVSLSELRRIKEKYGISIKAIIFRAKSTGYISESTAENWWNNYDDWYSNSTNGDEFGKFNGYENPVKFDKLITKGIRESKISWSKAAALKKTKVDLLKRKLSDYEFIV